LKTIDNNSMNFRAVAEQIFYAGVESVMPDRLISGVICVKDNCLKISNLDFSLDELENIYIIGAGKASASMGAEVEKILGDRITEGHIVVKHGFACKLRYIGISEAGHPVPDLNGFNATLKIMDLAHKAGKNDLVICLLSGGGSSLLTDAPEGCSMHDMRKASDLLLNCGASISEINAVRKHLSVIKGGQLSRIVYPATLVSLILSDVPGNNLDVIASGPTVPDPTTFSQAQNVLSSYGLMTNLPHGILNYINEGAEGRHPETPKPGDPVFEKTFNILIGSNNVALEAAKSRALEFNFNVIILNDQLQGDVLTVAEYLTDTALKFQNDESEIKPVCLLFGGETTVKVKGKGVGGRNQHLALLSAILLRDKPGISILASGTDGNDGRSDAAGAVVDSETIASALLHGIDPEKYLNDFDSFHFFKKAGGHIITGPTMTNVMDIIVVIIY
jgi:glycerate 2-kinase